MDKTGRLNYIEMGIDDMTNLVELSDESLLYNLQTRYNQKIIYTYIGSILISINPYTELNIYDKKHILRYQNKSMQDVPPHLFGIAEINYSKMMMENENQVIVISGESGAGKTESFKRILRYLATTSGGAKELHSSDLDRSNDIANKILDCTPLLESFGNAQTIRNDNSSRFGKYVEIFFENGIICGSRTTNYLLEKSRIVKINPDERGYHIFYELLQGLDSFGKSQYNLKNVSDYAYLNNAKKFSVKGRDDGANLKEFMGQWSTLGLTSADLDVAMRVVSAVLHLGNIRFREEEDASYMIETENVNVVAKMLKIDSKSLIGCLTMKTTDTVKDFASSPVNAEQAANLRDTLAKHLYSELFDWIVLKVNESLNNKTSTLKRSTSHLDRSMNSSTSNLRCIAMLDIYGFENFPENSLEQLCINYANETLQQFFNRYVFELEQAEYKQEGISWHYVTYPDNQPIIDLLSLKPSGIIQILNDECSIPQGTDGAFLTKCHNVHQKNPNFEKPKKVDPPQFIIRHFAGNIFYNVTGFLEKNRDIIRKESILLIEHCGVEEISNMFKKKKEKTLKNPNTKARTPAVMADFQNSLGTLLNKMKSSQPWFIRCLKPNNNKQALIFNNDIVMDQMRYTGILETVKIRKSGFPIRIIFSLFLSRFYLLQSKEMRRFSKKSPQEACLKMLPQFQGQKGKDFEVGRTKLFLKEHFARHLESQVRVIRERSAIKIQRKWREYWKIREIIVKNKAATRLQAIVKGFIVRRRVKRLHTAIIRLQSFVRMQLVRRRFIEKHPEFLKYSIDTADHQVTKSTKSTAISYKFPDTDVTRKQKIHQKNASHSKFNYNLLKIPMKLAFLLERSTENYGSGHEIPSQESIMQTCRAQHIYNRDEYQLPTDINSYVIEEFLEEFGNNIPLESKMRPITNPFLKENMSSSLRDDSLNAHKLILRLMYADSMPWFHRYISGSFLSYMASTSAQLQMEILLQVIAETIHHRNDSHRNHAVSDMDSNRLTTGWTLLGNLLSHIIPVPKIFNYVLKYVSDSFGVDQACTCQEKLLQFVSERMTRIPRLFPASNLEWRANSRGVKTSLNVFHADDVTNSVHVNSFSTAESLANHSLCFRLKRFRENKGWSISIVVGDSVIDCSGHSYVLDAVSGLELTSHWADIVGYGIEHKFLISRKSKKPKSVNSRNIQSNILKQPKKYPNESLNKSIATISSRKSMDSWVDKYFDKSFRFEETADIRVHDYIHGVEDDLKNRGINMTSASFPSTGQSTMQPIQMAMPGFVTPQPAYQYVPIQYTGPYPSNYYYPTNPDKRFLEDKLTSVELENKVIQSSIDNELLQKRLQELRQQSSTHHPGQNPFQQYSYPMQAPYAPLMYPLPINQVPFMPQGNFQMPFMQPQYVTSDVYSSHSMIKHASDSGNTGNVPSNLIKVTKSVQTKRNAPSPPNSRDEDQHTNNETTDSETSVNHSDKLPRPNVAIRRPKQTENENLTPSQIRASEIPKIDISTRAEFLNNFFADKEKQKTPQANVKHTEPSRPSTFNSPPPPRYEGQVPAPPPLVPQPKLIPRPRIHPRVTSYLPKEIKKDSEDIIKKTEIEETFAKLDESFNSVRRSPKEEPPKIVKRRKRGISSGKVAIILSGLPDIRYYTYTNLPWFPMVKIELLLPKDIQDSTLLNPVIFCQIVRDLTEFPCIRWVGNERTELLTMIGGIEHVTNVQSLLSTPSNIILRVIDRTQRCELYFSRFYSIKWISTNASGQVCHWLAISHSGIRFVEQNLKNPEINLNIIGHIPYSDVGEITSEDPDTYGSPQKIIIRTRTNKIYEMLCTHALSAMNLVYEFIGERDDFNTKETLQSRNGLSSELFKPKKTKRKQVEDVQFVPDQSTDLMTLGVNNQRIPIKKFYGKVSPTGDLIDFILSRSNQRTRAELENSVLKWDRSSIIEPMLPSMNSKLAVKAIEIYQTILALSGDIEIGTNSSIIDHGELLFKTIYHNKELLEEVVIQIWKQINGNPRQKNRIYLWNALSTLIIFFGVTKRLEPYLLEHLKRLTKNPINPDNDHATNLLKNLQKSMTYGPRKQMPLENELKHLLGGMREAKITIYMPRDAEEHSVAFNDTVGDVIRTICLSLDMTVEHETYEYTIGLVEVNERKIPIRLAECLKMETYLFDAINSLAKDLKLNFIFYFSRCSWIFPIIPKTRSRKLINLLFNQLSQDILTGNWMYGKASDRHLLGIITAIAYFNLKGQGYEKPINDDLLQLILPDYLLSHNNPSPTKQELINMIHSTPSTLDITAMRERADFQRKFIELIAELPRYGWITLPIVRVSHIPSVNDLTINFTPENVVFCKDANNELILKISLRSLSSFQVSKVNTTMAQFALRYNGIQEIHFTTEKISEIAFLLNEYLNIRAQTPTQRL